MSSRQFGPYSFETSREDKVLFPDAGITKGELIEYYVRIAETLLPHLAGRPLSLKRHPDGFDREGFYQKNVAEYFPDWLERVTVGKEEGGQVTHAVARRAADLAYLANQAVIEFHVWLSRVCDLRHPDRLIIDLDPPDGRFDVVRAGALHLRERLSKAGLRPHVMTTGSRGLHVVVPLRPVADFDAVRAFANEVCDGLAATQCEHFTTAQRKDKRGERVFLDMNRNAYGQTGVAPYTVRARPGAPVAVPLDWDELNDETLTPDRYTIRNVFRRLGQKKDPWAGIQRHAAALP